MRDRLSLRRQTSRCSRGALAALIYIGTGRNGILRVYRLGDGRELNSHALGSTIFGTPAAADGTALAGDWGGDRWAFKP